jgi:hypothetical protein
VPFQTVQERKIQPNGLEDPVWLRTCYNPDLDEAYEELADNAELAEGYSITNSAAVLDNSSLYNFGSDWTKILTRIPRLCDFVTGSVSEDYNDWEEYKAGDCEMSGLERISRHVHTVVYVVDEDAIKERLVKIMWLDSHGNCVWDNKMKPEGLTALRGGLTGGGSLCEIVADSGGDIDSPTRGIRLAR